MRKPSDLSLYVNNKIKELAEKFIIAEAKVSEEMTFENNLELAVIRSQLDILFTIQKICNERKRF